MGVRPAPALPSRGSLGWELALKWAGPVAAHFIHADGNCWQELLRGQLGWWEPLTVIQVSLCLLRILFRRPVNAQFSSGPFAHLLKVIVHWLHSVRGARGSRLLDRKSGIVFLFLYPVHVEVRVGVALCVLSARLCVEEFLE